MKLINPDFKEIKFGRKKIKVRYANILRDKNCYGEYNPNDNTVTFDSNLKGEEFLNTLIHELFHIIITLNKISVKDRGEEPIAMAVGDGFTKILKQNPKIRDFIYECFDV